MQIIKYEVNDGLLTVGFKEMNFVVYSQIPHYSGLTKQQLLQKAYEQIKQTIDYEKTLQEHSFTTDEIGEEFVPELPKPIALDVDFDNLTGTVLDQYGDIYSEEDIEFTIEGTDKARIEDNIIVEDATEEDTEYFIVARWGGLEEKQKRIIYALEPDRVNELRNEVYGELNRVNEMENQVLEVQNYIVEKEYQELLEKGGL